MERLTKLTKLLNFLRVGEPSLDQIVQFITLDTLYDFSAFMTFINVVRIDGTVHIPSGFGYEEKFFARIPNRLVTMNTPINHTLRTGEIMEGGDFDHYVFAGEGYSKQLFPFGFAQSLAFPIPGVGALVIFCAKRTELSVEYREFLHIVGKILSRYMLNNDSLAQPGRDHVQPENQINISLTPRQWKILDGIRKGFTNVSISKDLGVSESLVRQETVRIYRKLGVTGKKEILVREDMINEKLKSVS